jgi:hypothetical protein
MGFVLSPLTPGSTVESAEITAGTIVASDIADGTITYAKLNADATSGRELGYAEITANATTTSTTAVDVAGLSTTVTVADRPIIVEFGCTALGNVTDSSGVNVFIVDTSGPTNVAIGFRGSPTVSAGDALQSTSVMIRRRLDPAAGSKTYKLQLAAVTAGTAVITASAESPAWIQVTEV